MTVYKYVSTDKEDSALTAAREAADAVGENGEPMQFADNGVYLQFVIARAIVSYAGRYGVSLSE